jgi:hypothetical protein
MSEGNTPPRPPVPYIADGSQDAAVIVAINEQRRRVAVVSGVVDPPMVPPPPPVFSHDGSAEAAMFADWEARHRQWFRTAAMAGSTGPVYVPEDDFPVLVSQAVIIPYQKTSEGTLSGRLRSRCSPSSG